MPSGNSQRGHRKRLREKFLKSGLAGFNDYEIVELLLSLGTPRKDCKVPAKEALKRFQTLRGVMEASPDDLQEIEGIGNHSAFGIKLVKEVAGEYLKAKALEKPFFSSSREIFDYLYHSMRGLKKEVFRVIYLNSQNQIINTIDLSKGTINSSSVSLREVIEGAVKNNAVSIIFVHNHPSGNPQPSESDRSLTRELVYAGRIMRLMILDHIIIGDDKYFSFAGDGLIKKYENDFLDFMLRGTADSRHTYYRNGLPPD